MSGRPGAQPLPRFCWKADGSGRRWRGGGRQCVPEDSTRPLGGTEGAVCEEQGGAHFLSSDRIVSRSDGGTTPQWASLTLLSGPSNTRLLEPAWNEKALRNDPFQSR